MSNARAESGAWSVDRVPHEILIVDDDPRLAALCAQLLELRGHRVVVAHDGFEALDLLRTRSFDLIFMDWNMPGLHGLQVTRRIRAGEAGESRRDIPVVALTGTNDFGAREQSMLAGMNDHVRKPASTDCLEEILRRHVRPRRLAR